MRLEMCVAAALLAAGGAWAGVASSVDLERCVFKTTGRPVPQDECDLMRRIREGEAAQAQRQSEDQTRVAAQIEADSREIQRKLDAIPTRPEQFEKLSAADCARYPQCVSYRDAQAKREAEAALLRRADEEWKREEREEAARNKAEAVRRAACGGDYKAPRVGMSIERVRQCVAPLKVAGQINRKDGVVTTFVTSSGAYFHAMDGLVIAWGR